MGTCFSFLEKPMARIGSTIIRGSKFKKIKSYHDALRAAGYVIPDTASIILVCDGVHILNVPVYKPFQFVDSIKYGTLTIPIKRLYGKKNGLKPSQ
jgi:hypothetical protein